MHTLGNELIYDPVVRRGDLVGDEDDLVHRESRALAPVAKLYCSEFARVPVHKGTVGYDTLEGVSLPTKSGE